MRRLVNGTAVAWRGQGVLILGPTGAGKSDLTLRLIDSGATLIADDLVEMKRDGGALLLSFPPEGPPDLKGMIEVEGLGIMSVPAAPARGSAGAGGRSDRPGQSRTDTGILNLNGLACR